MIGLVTRTCGDPKNDTASLPKYDKSILSSDKMPPHAFLSGVNYGMSVVNLF